MNNMQKEEIKGGGGGVSRDNYSVVCLIKHIARLLFRDIYFVKFRLVRVFF